MDGAVMMAVMVAVTGGVSGILGALLAYLLGVRLHSGRVSTTDADRLWEQNDKLIEALGRDNQELRQRVHEVETQNRELERRVAASEFAERECSRRAERLEQELTALREALQPQGSSKEASL
jgi:septal ring factor EnvC (AmiA/AmiB activator)